MSDGIRRFCGLCGDRMYHRPDAWRPGLCTNCAALADQVAADVTHGDMTAGAQRVLERILNGEK